MSNSTANSTLLAPENMPDGSNQFVPEKWFTSHNRANLESQKIAYEKRAPHRDEFTRLRSVRVAIGPHA